MFDDTWLELPNTVTAREPDPHTCFCGVVREKGGTFAVRFCDWYTHQREDSHLRAALAFYAAGYKGQVEPRAAEFARVERNRL